MSDPWQVQEAKNRFSEVIDKALREGPQVVTRHGRAVVRVVAVDASAASGPQPDDGFVKYLLDAPKVDGLEPPPRRSRRSAPLLGG